LNDRKDRGLRVFEIDVADGIALLRFNRPDVMNAMSPELLVRMLAAWERVRDDPAIRVAVVTGAGDRAFSSGADLGRLIPLLTGARAAEDEYDRALLDDPTIPGRASLRDMDVGKPVIAAVNGYCLAGGMEFLQGTDIRVAATTARFGLKEVQRGLIASGGSCARLARQVPFVQAMEILLTGETFTAAKALEIGLVNHVVEPEHLLDKAFGIARRIAENGPLAVQTTRRAIRECLGRPEVEAIALEQDIAAPVWTSQDAREGPRAFLEKRAPRFVGR
jgi:enoyl-CoA hydratase